MTIVGSRHVDPRETVSAPCSSPTSSRLSPTVPEVVFCDCPRLSPTVPRLPGTVTGTVPGGSLSPRSGDKSRGRSPLGRICETPACSDCPRTGDGGLPGFSPGELAVIATFRRGGVHVRPGGGRAHGWRLCIEPGAARLEVGAGSRMWLDAGSFPLPWSTPRPRRPEVVVELRRPKVQAEPAGSPVSRATSRPAAPAHGSLSACAGAGHEGTRKGSDRLTYLGSASTRETGRETRAMAKWGRLSKTGVGGRHAAEGSREKPTLRGQIQDPQWFRGVPRE